MFAFMNFAEDIFTSNIVDSAEDIEYTFVMQRV